MDKDKCNHEIYTNGKQIAVLDANKELMNFICEDIKRKFDITVDWHYSGGRCIVKALEDLEKAGDALKSYYFYRLD